MKRCKFVSNVNTMNVLLTKEKEIIIRSFEKSSDGYWKTLGEIATDSAVNLEDVLKIVFNSKEFVQSSYRLKEGQPVFTTRELFNEKTPFLMKLLGAFKGTID